MTTQYARVQNNGGTEASLLTGNQIPLARELVVATDTGRIWVGDGQRTLKALPSITPGSSAAPNTAIIDDANVSESTVYSSAEVVSLIRGLQSSGSSTLVALQALVQNADGSYPSQGTPVTVYAGSTPPDPSTLTGPAFFILTSTT
jgi:hypothetical protein